ncbi:MAG: hypothetical protein WBQ18_12825 [Solirubrobacteraceae bacterium]
MLVGLFVVSAAFGAVDSYLGSLSWSQAAVAASGLAAPWLVLAFAIGAVQRSGRMAALVALLCVVVALFGFIAMTWSPIEGASPRISQMPSIVFSQIRWFVLGVLTAPVMGWLGFRWRETRSLWPSLIIATALVVERPIRAAAGDSALGMPVRSALAQWLEVSTGLVIAGLAVLLRCVPNMSRAPVRWRGRPASKNE